MNDTGKSTTQTVQGAGLLQRLFAPSHAKRFAFFLLADAALVAASLAIAFFLRFEFRPSAQDRLQLLHALPLFIAVKLAFFLVFRFYRMTWRYVGLNDLWNIVNTVIIAEAALLFIVMVAPDHLPSPLGPVDLAVLRGFPRSVFLIDGILTIVLVSSLRISKRLVLEVLQRRGQGLRQGKRTLIIGAGNTGEMLLRDMARQGYGTFYPVGMLDDNALKVGSYVHGVKVYATTERLREIIGRQGVEALIIAIPSLNYRVLRKICDDGREAGVSTIKIIPRIYDFHKPEINLKDLEEISIEDLLGRQTVTVDSEEIASFLRGKTVLITGAGGSIGSEITLQVCGFDPAAVVLFDMDETALHNMRIRIDRRYPHLGSRVVCAVGDVRDAARVREVLHAHAPRIVFHAAAYKHVPMMEGNPKEAVKANIFGTHVLANASVDGSVEKFIMISTDKAVQPTSIMGATKRMAENICRALNGTNGTEFVAVRFGNVLGSRGSVLPLFLEQLKHGGPLTVTHRDMQRYFMTIPEAVTLVLQASVIGKGGEVMVLDMGVPIMIVKLAEELIRIHGLVPYRDIDIQFTGMRPGEKLFEELLTAEEGTITTRSNKVFVARSSDRFTPRDIDGILAEFRDALSAGPAEADTRIRTLLRKYIRHYHADAVPPPAPEAPS